VGFSDVLAVDRRAILRIEITNQQDAAGLTDLAVNSAYPAVVQTDIGVGVSTEYGWQLVDDGPTPGLAGGETNKSDFHVGGSEGRWERTNPRTA
jgi:hypothetical protein